MIFYSESDLAPERRFTASPARVRRKLTEPRPIRHWFAPKPVETREAGIDLRPGVAYFTLILLSDGSGIGNDGRILAVAPARRMVFTDMLRGDW